MRVRRVEPVPDPLRLETLPRPPAAAPLSPWMDALDRNVERLNQLLYGPQQYAVIARRPFRRV